MTSPEKSTSTLVYLHGVKNKGPWAEASNRWRDGLNRGLAAAGYSPLEDDNIIAPTYPDLLLRLNGDPKGKDATVPPITQSKLSSSERKQERTNFDKRMAAMERRLADAAGYGPKPIANVAGVAAGAAFRLKNLREASNYMHDDAVRRGVLNRVIDQLPDSGSIVIVGHSLGSVIAADLLPRIPRHLKVAGMITIGSPLAQGNFDLGKLDTDLKEPPSNLAWWVNFWSHWDPVAALRGASTVVPWLLDVRVSTPMQPKAAHSAHEYLENELVGKAIGYALFGSQSTDLAVIETGLDVQLDHDEKLVLANLRMAHLIWRQLKGSTKQQYGGALADTQFQVVDDLIAKRKLEGRSIPSAISYLQTSDVGDPDTLRIPVVSLFPTREEAAKDLVTLAVQNPLLPYEVEVKESVRIQAMRQLAVEMQLTARQGEDVFDALDEASKALAGKTRFVKWGLMGVGAVAVAASGGLLLPATPGLVGAAALTSALASFGPGGMIGGLITAGALVSAGSGTIAVGAMTSGSTPDEVEGILQVQMARQIMRAKWRMSIDQSVWQMWTDLERDLIRKQTRLERFSDKNSRGLKDTERKLATVRRAIRYSIENDLSPTTQ